MPVILAALVGCGAPEPPRLMLLISVDTLRADHLGAYGSDLGLTPELDALAAESLVFDAAYAPSAMTLPSLSGLFTGRHPGLLGVQSNESVLPRAAPTLAQALRERGWRTAAVVGNYVLRRASGMSRGFDWYDDELPQAEPTRGWPERVASSTTDAALRAAEGCAERSERPCFLWVHYEDPHGPYTPPGDLRQRQLAAERRRPDGALRLPVRSDQRGSGGIPAYQALPGEREVAFYRAGYAGEVAFTDAEIGRLLRGLRSRVPWSATVVVFAADHGESLGEDDLWFAHGERLSEVLVRVPLFLRLPGRGPGRRADVVGLLDVAPTLARAFAGADSGLARAGRDLLAPDAAAGGSRVLLATLRGGSAPRLGVVEGGYKLVWSDEGGAAAAQLLLRGDDTAVEPEAAAPEERSRLAAALEAFRGELEAAPAEQRQALSAEDRERLRSLGYAL